MAKGDEREIGFQDGGCFSRFLKRERINNQTFIALLNCEFVIRFRVRVRVSFRNDINVWLLCHSRFKNLEKQPPS